MSRNKNRKKQIQYKTLLSVLANGSEMEARDLLKKHSGQDAQDTQDLEVKLARVYALSPSKIDIEKEFAKIHPHKDFILKYNKPVEELKPLKPETIVKEVTTENQPTVIKQVVAHDGYSNANGDVNCPCNCPHCNRMRMGMGHGMGPGYFSNADGQPKAPTDYVGIIGVIGVVGLVFYVMSKTTK